MTVSGTQTAGGRVVSVVLFMLSMGVLSVCLSRRVGNVRDWGRLPMVCWLVIVIYVDSLVFIMGASIISHGFDMESTKTLCGQAILLCLACYMTTKFIYYFLVERAYIISGTVKPRLKDKLYLFNSFGMLIPYCVVICLNFYFRFANYENRTCRIGMKKVAMIPLIAFDILVNIYLTSLFLFPLRSLYSYKTNRNSQARSLALRTFIGSCGTLISSVVNLTTVMVLEGEPGWICLMCCNVDIIFSVLVLHWITSKDNASTIITSTATPANTNNHHHSHSQCPPNENTSSANPLPPLAQPNYTTQPPKRPIPRPEIAGLEAFELGICSLTQPAVVTRVTADSHQHNRNGDGNEEIGGGAAESMADGLGLQRIRTWQGSGAGLGMGADFGGVKIEIEQTRTVESVGVCGIDLDGNEILGYGVDVESDHGGVKESMDRETEVEPEIEREKARPQSLRTERRRSGWVREGRIRAERSAGTSGAGRRGSSSGREGREGRGSDGCAALVATSAPIEGLDDESL